MKRSSQPLQVLTTLSLLLLLLPPSQPLPNAESSDSNPTQSQASNINQSDASNSDESRASNRLPLAHTGPAPRSWIRACYIADGVPFNKIDPFLCTHLFTFAGHVTENGTLNITGGHEGDVATLLKLRDEKNPKLRILLTVAGNSDTYAGVAGSGESRAKFAASAAQLLEETGADGVDLDWEFPAWLRPGHERHDFTLLLEALRDQLHALPRPRLLTVAVCAVSTVVEVSYEVAGIAAAVDYVSIMAYDFHFYQLLQPATGHNAPLFASKPDRGYFATLNTNFSAHFWLDRGLPKSKLLLGIPVYGHGYRLQDPEVHGLYAPAAGKWGNGYVHYADVCSLLASNATEVWDEFALAPYLFSGGVWVSFENVRSIAAKAAYVRSLDVAGAMTYDLGFDDWSGKCGEGKFPLHKLIRDMLPSLE